MATSHTDAIKTGGHAVNRLNEKTSVDMMQAVRLIGGSMIGIAVLVVVLNEVFSIDAIANSNGSFDSVITSLENTGGAALGLLVIGLLVVGANRIMSFFGGGGF